EAGLDKTVQVGELDAGGHVAAVETEALSPERLVKVIEGRSFNEVLQAAERLSSGEREHYTLVRVPDTEPLDNAQARLREWYQHAVLEQPQIAVGGGGPVLVGDDKTLTV